MRRHTRIPGFIFTALLAAALCSSCGTGAPAPSEARVQIQEIFPLVPFSREFMNQIRREGTYQLSDLQYYISTGVILEEPSINERIVLTPVGDAVIQRREMVRQIQINSWTHGIMALEESAAPGEPGDAMKVYFDERYRNNPLEFRESPVDYRYYLIYDEASNTIDLNGVTYQFRYIGNSPPFLMVRLKEHLEQRINPVRMRGVAVRKVKIDKWEPRELRTGRNDLVISLIKDTLYSEYITAIQLSTGARGIAIQTQPDPPGYMETGTQDVTARIVVERSAFADPAAAPRGDARNPNRIGFTLTFTDHLGFTWEDYFEMPVSQ